MTARRRGRVLLRELGVRGPVDARALCDRLAARRGRPIRLQAQPIEDPGVSGACLSTGRTDFIFYESQTSPVHQDHIIVHELAHLLAGHAAGAVVSVPLPAGRPAASRTETAPARWLRRHRAADACEAEAEEAAARAVGWPPSVNPWAWLRHWRTYRALGPLWEVLRSLCPALSSGPSPSSWRKRSPWWPPWQARRRAYQRLIECRDGLLRLAPYLDDPVAVPDSPGLDADAAALIRVSQAIRTARSRADASSRCPFRHP